MSSTAKKYLSIFLGAIVLIWPVIFNAYPIVFSDSHVFITQPAPGFFNWDKPFVYGPWMLLFHGWQTLWPVCVAQAVIVSQLLWLVQGALGISNPLRHFLVCCVLAVMTTAPWFVSFLMPDLFAAATVLCIFVLGFHSKLSRSLTVWLVVLGAFAIAVHLSHLVIAAACLLVVLLLNRKRCLLVLVPLVVAHALLVGTSYYAFQRLAVSPYGSVFFLARLAGDGHVKPILEEHCQEKRWYLCRWVNEIPTDSDEFLWRGDGPVWSHPGGPMALAPEGSELIKYVLLERPFAVLQTSLFNAWQQFWLFELGDVLEPTHLDATVGQALHQHFPPREQENFKDSRQMAGTLLADARFFRLLSHTGMWLALLLSAWLLWQAVRLRDAKAFALIAMIWVGLMANALATGALSKPQHRYQARVIWLIALPPLFLIDRRRFR